MLRGKTSLLMRRWEKKANIFLARFSAPFFLLSTLCCCWFNPKNITEILPIPLHSRLVFQTKLNWKWNGINKYFNRGIERDAEVVERDGTVLLVGAFRVFNGLSPDWAVPHAGGIFFSIFFHPSRSSPSFPPLLWNLIWSIFNFDLVPI